MADDNEEHNEGTADRDLFSYADIINAYVRCQSNPMHAQEWIFLTEKGLNAEPNYFPLVVTISQYSTSRFNVQFVFLCYSQVGLYCALCEPRQDQQRSK